NSDSSSESGDSGGGVSIAAGISINWVIATNTATITGVHLTSGGLIKISAQSHSTANAFAIGAAVDLEHSDTSIGAAVGLNVVSVTNTANIPTGATVTGNGVTVEAVTPDGKRNDFISWGLAAAGGKDDASVAGSVGVQVLTLHSNAFIDKGAHVTSTDTLTVNATDPIGLQTIALAGGLSTGGDAVGGAIIVNVLDIQTKAFIDSDTTVGGTTHVDVTN